MFYIYFSTLARNFTQTGRRQRNRRNQIWNQQEFKRDQLFGLDHLGASFKSKYTDCELQHKVLFPEAFKCQKSVDQFINGGIYYFRTTKPDDDKYW